MSSIANSVLSQYGTSSSSTTSTDRLASDKHTFLKLLVAQLTNQDPLDPTDDKEFVAQLAQFTSLEQLQEINAGMETLNTTMTQSQLMSATSFIGKDVVVSGQQVTKLNNDDGDILTTYNYFTIEESAAACQVTVLDGNGNLVYYQDLGSVQAGTYPYSWPGVNTSGNEVDNGVYQIYVTAQDSNGSAILVNQQFTATVYGVMVEDGVYKLVLDGGRTVAITDVNQVSDTTSLSSGTTTDGTDTSADDSSGSSGG
ncbi:MAG: hypothetical protein DELT_00895 [Desulfovibrio sp.]